MGREAECDARVGAESGRVKALLESQELVLGGGFRRRYALAALRSVAVVDGWLRFSADGEAVALALGPTQAASWAKKIATPPPGLAARLGVAATQPAWVIGPLDDAELAAALDGATTALAAEAVLTVAVVRDVPALEAALRLHETLPPGRHLWVVHPKGRAASLGEGAVRERLRAAGYVDSKSTAISARLTATRYARR